MESSLIITIINFLYYVYPLKEEVCAPVDRDKFTKRLYEIWHLLTLVRPGYIFENKMADNRKRIAVNILAFACARIPPPPPPPFPLPFELCRLPKTSSQPHVNGQLNFMKK